MNIDSNTKRLIGNLIVIINVLILGIGIGYYISADAQIVDCNKAINEATAPYQTVNTQSFPEITWQLPNLTTTRT
jgi:hypothetical protein